MFLRTCLWLALSFGIPIYLIRTLLGSPRAIEVGAISLDKKHGRPRRSLIATKALTASPKPNILTTYDILQWAAKNFKSKKGYGVRRVVRTVSEEKDVTKFVNGQATKEKKIWNFYELSGYSWMTYGEFAEAATNLGAGLRAIGVKPGDKLTLFAKTSRDWMLTANACWTQNITITTAYDTLGEDGLSFSLNECEVEVLYTDAELLKIISKVAPLVTRVSKVIYSGQADEAVLEKLKTDLPHYSFYQLDDLIELGAKEPVDVNPPTPDAVACIMYTSGSTGNPKGVVLTHANLVGGVSGAYSVVEPVFTNDEYYLAYLPLAHVLECVVELTCTFSGVAIGYGSVRTLTDSSVRNCRGDLRELRPTLMTGVPAVWETIRKGVINEVKKQTPMKQNIFNYACALKWNMLRLGLPTAFMDKMIFKAVQSQTGGRLRFALSGGAPMPADTQKFMTTCLCPILNGYGLTETVGMGAIQLPDDKSTLGRCGPPTSAVEIKLVAVKDTAYHPLNRPRPQGEVWIRGSAVMKGYYLQPKMTDEVLTEDGWFMTGDIGEFHADGTLQIIDRKKNLVKLSNGEYIALEKLESQYKTSSFVQNICVYGDSHQGFAIAIINPIEKEIMAKAKELGVSTDRELEDIVKDPKIVQAVLESIRAVGKQAGFKPAEIIGNLLIAHELWTPENGFLTAAQKLKRKEIVDRFKEDIDTMYSKGRI